ncbi:MAG: transcriptional regulator [Gemmatimonadetes bacterium]|nr:transcriptional regulator [Gemmatimonadota bacterium]
MSTFDYRKLDDVIHSRIRLAVMAILASVEDAEFTYLRDAVGATDGNLSTHLSRLAEAGYVEVDKRFEGSRPVSRYGLTAEGRGAFRAYVERMERLLGSVGP